MKGQKIGGRREEKCEKWRTTACIDREAEREKEREREREIGEPRIHSVWKRLVETRIDDGPAAVREIDCRPLG